MLTVGLFSDHGGFSLKEKILAHPMDGTLWVDYGTFSAESVDYPIFGKAAAYKLQESEIDRAILICGTGIGISIAANRFAHVRAFVCHTADEARLARQHNDANVICFGGRFQSVESVLPLLKIFIATPFEGGRHQQRIDQLFSV